MDIPAELRKDETSFDHFGMMNLLVDGGSATMYFNDLQFNDTAEDFSKDPNWDGSRNRGKFTESEPHGVQNFGFSDTAFAGGKPGEIGGIFWRDVKGGHYADRVGPLSLEDPLEASGKVNLVVGGTDSDVTIGWFHSSDHAADKAKGERASAPNFLGVHIGGPTRVGHYFLPQVITSTGTMMGKSHLGSFLAAKFVQDRAFYFDPITTGKKKAFSSDIRCERSTASFHSSR